jgi:hypothetical protein
MGDEGAAMPACPAVAGLEVHVWDDDGRPLVELVQLY